MQDSLNASLVRIRTTDGRVVGAGFLVGERQIITCAHVVSQSLDLADYPLDAPQGLVSLDFPLIPPRTLLTAKVVLWCPPLTDGRGDIAGLELQGEPPAGAEVVRFAPAEDVWKHPFRAFGFPSGYDNGVYATGRLLGREATDWVMIEDVKAQGFPVGPGFSGTPVWDEHLQGVVGMVVAASRPMETRTAFVIPLDVLVAAWPLIEPITRQRVFLSTAPADTAFADRLTTDLQVRDIVVWSEQHTPGEKQVDQEERVRLAIRAAQAVVLVVSSQTRSSRIVREHPRLADLYQRRLILVWVGDDEHTPATPPGWRETVWVDAHDTHYAAALDAIEATLGQHRPVSALLGSPGTAAEEASGEPRNPYKGLHAFTAKDAGDFFGRERLIDELVKDIAGIVAPEQPGGDAGRLLTIIGPSGSGKSSVVMAGLLPRLQRGALPGSEAWVLLSPMVPGKHPIEALGLTLAPHFPDRSFTSIREDLEDDATRGLHVLAMQLVKQQGSKVVLLVDQFEELFTQTGSEDERRRFIDLLLTSVSEARGSLIVLLTLRADFSDRPMHYPDLGQLIERQRRAVFPMEIEDLRATIEQPAALPDVGLTFEGNLAGDLLFEMQGQIGALPLLEFTLDQLFERRSDHRLTLSAYREIGGVKGALSQHAEKTYATLPSDEHRRLARALFLRLIDLGTMEQDVTRRRAALSEFSLADATQTRLLRETADAFIAARLLTTNEIAGTTTIEVSHEAVIREWPRLGEWTRAAREDIPLQQNISRDVAEWQRHGKPGARLYRGSQLKEAQAWATRNTPSVQERTFLRASVVHRRRAAFNILAVALILLVSLSTVTWYVTHQPLNPTRVTNLNDNGVGSLRWATELAPTKSTITFDPGLRGTIVLSSADLTLQKDLTIKGPGARRLSVRGSSSGHIVHISPGATVSISDLAFQGDDKGCPQPGVFCTGLIENMGTLTLINSIVSGNTADIGGGIYNQGGTVKLVYSTISGNTATLGGGGIYSIADGALTLINSTISGNTVVQASGGGIYNGNGTLMMMNSTVSGNTASQNDGGGIASLSSDLTLINSTVSGNMAQGFGGGIVSAPSIVSVINNTNIINRSTVTNSTIANNKAGKGGGGIVVIGFSTKSSPLPVQVTLTSCTFSSNAASSGADIDILDSDFNGKQARQQFSSVMLRNSIVAGPSAPDMQGTFISQGYNLFLANSGAIFEPNTLTQHAKDKMVRDLSQVFATPAQLGKNEGQTMTLALLPGPSDPAVDVVPLASCRVDGITKDQRGKPRPDDGESMCDIGAFESS